MKNCTKNTTNTTPLNHRFKVIIVNQIDCCNRQNDYADNDDDDGGYVRDVEKEGLYEGMLWSIPFPLPPLFSSLFPLPP